MKKVIGFILVLAIVATAGYFAYDLYFSPEATAERNLMGEWVGSNEIGGLEFGEEGNVKISIKSVSTDGKYTANFETGELSITYSLLGLSYEMDYIFEVTETTLTLTDKTFNVTTNYTKVVTE